MITLLTNIDHLYTVGGRDYIDELLSGNKLAEVIVELKTKSSKEISSLSKDRFLEIFRVIEEHTKLVQENINDDGESFRRTSTARNDMTFMYKTLQSLGYLQIYGAATTTTSPVASSASTAENMYSETLLNLPAQGSKIVTPAILEMATFLPLSSLTPKPSNALFFAGSIAALLEIIFGLWTGIDYTLLVLSTLMAFLLDRLFFSGANVETLLRWLYPDSTRKIIHHEAGHFLLAYLLGCPVEGTVLSTWAALKDARFGGGSTNNRFPRVTVSAGTSFFDPELSYEMNRPIPSIRRTSIDKYSIIVMGGIAAEAMVYGNAEGGAGDEAQLIAFLSNLYSKKSMVASDWTNIELIKNQARFGVLQAVSVNHFSIQILCALTCNF
jgi:hypothetical protein